MSGGSIEFPRFRRRIGALTAAMALALGLTPALGAEARSSPEDRARFVSVTQSLEQMPLKAGAKDDRKWALEWLMEAPDINVTVCPEMLGGLLRSKYPYAGEIMLQDSFSTAAFMIEHPETAGDPNAQQLAGVEGALRAYRSILRDKPDAKSSDLEGLLQTQSRGELPDFVRKAWIRCSAKK